MDNIIVFDSIEEKLNKELAQGFRTCYAVVIKEITKTYNSLVKISGVSDAKSYAQKLISGANKDEITKLCSDLEVWGKHFVNLSHALTKEYLESHPEEDLNESDNNQGIEEVVREYFHKRSAIVDEMLNEYRERMLIEMERNFKIQLEGKKHFESMMKLQSAAE